MHEESRTIEQDGKYINVIGTNRYGEKGKRLSPMFPYEREAYDTEEEAEAAARRRSEDFGKLLDSSTQRHKEASLLGAAAKQYQR